MSVQIIRGNALDLPLEDSSVDLVVTSPPYFGLRSYQDGGQHYAGQIGAEATPAEFVDALIAATAEMVRVLKPSGSIWVNLGDKYASSSNGTIGHRAGSRDASARAAQGNRTGIPTKSLIGVPWRYALRCIDDLGLILRAEVIWSKPNGLPESVTDRVRRSHETWFHFVREPRYFSAVDEVREAHAPQSVARSGRNYNAGDGFSIGQPNTLNPEQFCNPLGKLPGSVWQIPTQPLQVPASLGVDHFAAFPMEWPRRIIRGWSPTGVCTACGEGRRPNRGTTCDQCGTFRPNNAKSCPGCSHRRDWQAGRVVDGAFGATDWSTAGHGTPRHPGGHENRSVLNGEACGCPDTTAPTTPAVVLDPFSGTGTTALVAHALGRHGIGVDMSSDYCRLAEWRTTDPGQLAAAMQVEKPDAVSPDQDSLLDLLVGEAS